MTVTNTLYELLEVDPGATDDEVRRGYKRLQQLFDPSGVVVYGLYSREEAAALRQRLRNAYDTILDPEKRRQYDRDLFPEGHPSLRRADERVAAAAPRPRPQPPSDPLAALGLADDAVITGDVLRQIRKVCHISLDEVADRTKISKFALRCLEADQYADLPARVYLKGFLTQIAGMLRLDPDRVVRDYVKGFDAWQAERSRRSW